MAQPVAHPDLRARQPHAIQTALAVLEVIGRSGPTTTAHEISSELGLPRSTTYRILGLLEQEEFVVRCQEGGGFALGPKARALSEPAVPYRTPQAVRMELTGLRRRIPDSLHLVAYGDRAAHVVDEDPREPLPDHFKRERQLNRTPCGVLLLSHLSGRHRTLTSLVSQIGPDWLADADDALWERLTTSREVGFVRARSAATGRQAVAVPVHGPADELVAALVVFAAARTQVGGYVPVLQRVAARLSPLLA